MTTFEVYWLTRLDNISGLLTAASIICGVALLAVPFVYMFADIEMDSESEAKAKRFTKSYAKWALGVLVASATLNVFIPSTKELVAIYGISYLTQNKDAREIPAAALKVLNKELQELAGEDKDD